MSDCNCQMAPAEQLKNLLNSDRPKDKEQAIACLVGFLTSEDRMDRDHGYQLFHEGIDEALFCSCLDYGSLVGGSTNPLLEALSRAVELWAARVLTSPKRLQSANDLEGRSR